MILETQQEKDAFEFIYELASEETSRRGCNDLETDVKDKFKGCLIEREDNGNKIMGPIVYDFDILHWLKSRVQNEN